MSSRIPEMRTTTLNDIYAIQSTILGSDIELRANITNQLMSRLSDIFCPNDMAYIAVNLFPNCLRWLTKAKGEIVNDPNPFNYFNWAYKTSNDAEPYELDDENAQALAFIKMIDITYPGAGVLNEITHYYNFYDSCVFRLAACAVRYVYGECTEKEFTTFIYNTETFMIQQHEKYKNRAYYMDIVHTLLKNCIKATTPTKYEFFENEESLYDIYWLEEICVNRLGKLISRLTDQYGVTTRDETMLTACRLRKALRLMSYTPLEDEDVEI